MWRREDDSTRREDVEGEGDERQNEIAERETES